MSNADTGTILVAIDGSHNAMVAAGVGARLAKLMGVHLGLVHILDVPTLAFWVGVEARMKDDIRDQAEKTLIDISGKISAACGVIPEYYILEGSPEEEILRVVSEDPNILMVVTGRRGLSTEKHSQVRLRRAAAGLGQKLGAHLPVPVLVVPSDISPSHICSAMVEFLTPPNADGK